jgi:phage shock protein A
MAKKIVVGVVAAVLVGVFLFGTRFFGLVGNSVDKLRQAAQDTVSPETKLELAKKAMPELDSVIEKQMRLMAETKQEIESLGTEIANRDQALGVQLAELGHLRNLEKNADKEFVSVKSGNTTKKYSVAELTNEIDIRTGSFKRGKEALETKRKLLEEKQKQYADHQKQYGELISKKEKLELAIESLQSKIATLETRKAVEAVNVDDSVISEVQSLIDEADRDVSVESNMLDLKTGKGAGRIEVDLSGEEDSSSREELDEILKQNDVQPAEELISTPIN